MRTIVFFILTFYALQANAQALMNIYRTGEPVVQYIINDIDSITYSAVGDPGLLASVTTAPLGAYTISTATLGGEVIPNGGTQITSRGVAWNTIGNPTIADDTTLNGMGTGVFESLLTGLSSNITYYARAYAINNAGIAYGNEVEFFVTADAYIPADGVTDIDGNFYPTFLASSGQEWMAENLRTCRYANGDSILHIVDNAQWAATNEGAWSVYNHNSNQQFDQFGKLYNGYTVDDPRNVCPMGWHVPSYAEWLELHLVNNGQGQGGGNLKATGIELWLAPNTGATNSSGFTALPGGKRLGGGGFLEIFGSGYWWTSTGTSSTLDAKVLFYSSNGIWNDPFSKLEGLSIRCIKDQ